MIVRVGRSRRRSPTRETHPGGSVRGESGGSRRRYNRYPYGSARVRWPPPDRHGSSRTIDRLVSGVPPSGAGRPGRSCPSWRASLRQPSTRLPDDHNGRTLAMLEPEDSSSPLTRLRAGSHFFGSAHACGRRIFDTRIHLAPTSRSLLLPTATALREERAAIVHRATCQTRIEVDGNDQGTLTVHDNGMGAGMNRAIGTGLRLARPVPNDSEEGSLSIMACQKNAASLGRYQSRNHRERRAMERRLASVKRGGGK